MKSVKMSVEIASEIAVISNRCDLKSLGGGLDLKSLAFLICASKT